MNFISGESRNQITLLPDSIDDYVGEGNSVRVINAYIDSLNLSELKFVKPQPNNTGRPMYDPKDLLKLYVYGYMNRIRSSRRLETETKRNLEVIWLLRKLSPDHKTISRFRRDNSVALKNVFRDFVKLCLNLELYGKELVAIDGSKFKAVNSKDRNLSANELTERIKRLTARIDEYIQQMDETDFYEDGVSVDISESEIKQVIERLSNRRTTYESYLEELTTSGETQKSLTDSEAKMMRGASGFDVSYNVQSSVDSKHKLIAEFNVTNCGNDMNQLFDMAKATAEILETPDITATADTGYNNASEIARCIENGITPQVIGSGGDLCVPCNSNESTEITSHENGKCIYIKERNIVICPMGNVLPPKYFKNVDRTARFYNYTACSNCTCRCMKSKYLAFGVRMKKDDFSKEYNADNLHVKQININPNPEITAQRKSLVEHPFGTIKRTMDAGYLLTKGIENAIGEFSLVFLAYNLKRVINIIGTKKLIEMIG
jgi:transposase